MPDDINVNPQNTQGNPEPDASTTDPTPDTPDVNDLQAQLENFKTQAEKAAKARDAAERALDLTKKDFSKFKREHQSETEQLAEQKQQAAEAERQFNIDRNTLRAEKILMSAQLAEDDYKDLIGHIVSDDANRTEDLAQGIVDLIVRKTTAAAKAEREKILKETPQPPAGGGDSPEADPFIEAFMKG